MWQTLLFAASSVAIPPPSLLTKLQFHLTIGDFYLHQEVLGLLSVPKRENPDESIMVIYSLSW